jgi:hypothetical protein
MGARLVIPQVIPVYGIMYKLKPSVEHQNYFTLYQRRCFFFWVFKTAFVAKTFAEAEVEMNKWFERKNAERYYNKYGVLLR